MVNILIDTSAVCSCTNIPLPLTNETIQIKGIGKELMTATRTKPTRLDLGSIVLTEQFWYLPENREGTVLGMDIMQKHGFIIHCLEKEIEICTDKTSKNKSCASIMSISTTDPVQQLIQKQSDTRANHEHDCDLTDFEVSIEGNSPPPQKQYKIKPEAEASEHGTVKELETRSIVRKCGPVTNSPRLPVPKGLSQATPNVANPATILIQLPDALSSGLDIKNGFLSLYPKDQGKLAFPINQTQFTWQRKCQEQHISPEAFHKDASEILSPTLSLLIGHSYMGWEKASKYRKKVLCSGLEHNSVQFNKKQKKIMHCSQLPLSVFYNAANIRKAPNSSSDISASRCLC
uniref:Uncharacterized protein n=1 Tax=Astyanax mexicanus TaxID=7994 RepID=A0A3B1KBU1_ASTMX